MNVESPAKKPGGVVKKGTRTRNNINNERKIQGTRGNTNKGRIFKNEYPPHPKIRKRNIWSVNTQQAINRESRLFLRI
jgi:hypothetical protein